MILELHVAGDNFVDYLKTWNLENDWHKYDSFCANYLLRFQWYDHNLLIILEL